MRDARKVIGLTAAAIVLQAWLAFPMRCGAQTLESPAPVGDPARGGRIALSCSRCHGEGGVSSEPWIPSLAGLKQRAIYKQLQDYRSHRRRPEWYMASIAQVLSLQDLADVSAFYEQQPRPGAKAGKNVHGPSALKSCGSCHDTAQGDAPQIAGQSPQYLEIQLSLFAQGIRTNDQNGVMQKIAQSLTRDEIRQISEVLGRKSR